MSAELTKAAIRALNMTDEERIEKLGMCSDELRERLDAEMSAIIWVLGPCLIWQEHGVFEDVIDHLRERVQAEVPAGV